MSSIPGTHSVEGRDWRRLFETLTIEGAVAHRPHYAGYSDGVGRDLTYSIMMLDIQRNLRPDHCEVAPEVENWPFSRWSKADTQTWAEMACCMFYGSDALLMDLFPFAGNRPEETPGPEIGALLDRARPGLEWIGKHFSKEMRTQGVGTPWREDAQAHVRTEKGRSLTELDASSFGPGHFLLPYGIPVSAEEQEVNALFGNLAWAFSDEEIRGLLSGGLFLDGVGARILCRRGFGPDIGVEATEIVAADTNPYSAERTVSDRTGIRRDFYFDLCQLPSLALVEPLPDAVEWTTIIGPRGQRIGAGMVAFENKLGGRVVTYAPVDPVCVPRACQYQTLYQRAIDFLSGGKFDGATVVGGGVYLLPIHFSGDGKQTVVVFNGSPDPAAPVVRLTCASEAPRRATVLAPLHKPVGIEVDVRKEKDYLMSEKEPKWKGVIKRLIRWVVTFFSENLAWDLITALVERNKILPVASLLSWFLVIALSIANWIRSMAVIDWLIYFLIFCGTITAAVSIWSSWSEIKNIWARRKKSQDEEDASDVDAVDFEVNPPSQAGDKYAKLRVHNTSGKPIECIAILSEIDVLIKPKIDKYEWKDARHAVNPDNRKLSWGDIEGEYYQIAPDDYGVLSLAIWKGTAVRDA